MRRQLATTYFRSIAASAHLFATTAASSSASFASRQQIVRALSFCHRKVASRLYLSTRGAAPLAVSEDDIPADERAREERIATEQASDRPENVRERIVAGKLDKWLDEVVLLRQKKDFGKLAQSAMWRPVPDETEAVWTDQFSNLLGVFRWQQPE